jgi:hypothetical protein
MAKKYECFDCGKQFEKQYQWMLHHDFHRGEPVVRATACIRCVADVDVRSGVCHKCGVVQSSGWTLLTNTEAK